MRLLHGELRQGAVEGVLLDAVARAASIPAERVRRAAMLAGALAPVAVAALADGEAALRAMDVALFAPVQPMLAESADDVERGARRSSARPRSNTSSTARASRCTRRATRSGSTRAACNDVTAARARGRRGRARAAGARADPRRRGDRAARRRHAAAVPGHDAPLRPQARRRRGCAASCRSRRSSSTACTSTARR